MKKLKIILSLAAVAAIATNANAQDSNTDSHTIGITIPEVALVDIEPTATKNITMSLTVPSEAGLPLGLPNADNTLWLNYSSIKSTADPTRNITVKLDALIPGVDIKVTAATATGSGDGDRGTPVAAPLTLSATDQTIINAIGSAYTGNGVNNGHNLTYALDFGNTSGIANYADLEATNTATAVVTYTISDN